MRKSLRKLMVVALLSLTLVAGGYGCARGRGNGARPGETRAGLVGPVGGRRQAGRGSKDLGQQISDLVAAIDGLEAVAVNVPLSGKGGVGGPVGVSTLLLGDEAFVGIDPATLTWSGKTGDLGGGTAGGIPAVGVPITGDPALRGAAGTTAGGGGPAGAPSASGGTAEFRKMVDSYVTAAFPQIRAVYVTTDPALVYRIAALSRRIQNGATLDQAEARAVADAVKAGSEVSP